MGLFCDVHLDTALSLRQAGEAVAANDPFRTDERFGRLSFACRRADLRLL